MSQLFDAETNDVAVDAALANHRDALWSLQTHFSGATAPASPATHQIWYDTTTGTAKVYDGSAWQIIGPILAPVLQTVQLLDINLTVGGVTAYIPPQATKCVMHSIRMVSDTLTTSDPTNNWEWKLENMTTASQMFASNPTTDDVEFAVDTANNLTPDQNQTFAIDDIVRFSIIENGTADHLTQLVIAACFYPRAT